MGEASGNVPASASGEESEESEQAKSPAPARVTKNIAPQTSSVRMACARAGCVPPQRTAKSRHARATKVRRRRGKFVGAYFTHVTVAITLHPEQLESQPYDVPSNEQKRPPGLPPIVNAVARANAWSTHCLSAVFSFVSSFVPL